MLPTLSLSAVALVTTSVMAPKHPNATPMAFFDVRGSFKMTNDNIMAKIGIAVVTILALTGDVMLRPIVKQHWLHTSPNIAASIIFSLSATGTLSFAVKNDVSQKSNAPPATLKDTMLMPSIPWSMAYFPTGAIRPHIAQAPNMLRWAKSGVLLSILPFFYSISVAKLLN